MRVAPLIERVGPIAELFEAESDYRPFAALRAAEGNERPLGGDDFVMQIDRVVGRRLRPLKPGRKPRERAEQMELEIGKMGKVSP